MGAGSGQEIVIDEGLAMLFTGHLFVSFLSALQTKSDQKTETETEAAAATAAAEQAQRKWQ